MRTVKAVLPVALVAGAVALLPAAASADAGSRHDQKAHAAGGDPVPVLPSAVRVRIKRGQNALDKVGDYVDKGEPDKAVNSLRGARANMYAAWRAAKYGIVNAPPPVEEDKAIARASGDLGPGTLYAAPQETAVAVLGYQHDVFTATLGLLDDAKGSLRDALSTTMFAALDRRDSAIAFIHTVPDPDVEAKAIAQASAVAPTAGFAALMPGVTGDLDDEQAQAAELLANGALTPGEKRIVRLAQSQTLRTENTINTYWPPATED